MPSTPQRSSKRLAAIKESKAKEKCTIPSPPKKRARTSKPPRHTGKSSFRKRKTGTGSTAAKAATKKRAPGRLGQAKGLTTLKCGAVYQYHINTDPDSKVQQTLTVDGETIHNLQAFKASKKPFFGLDQEYCVLYKGRMVLPLDRGSEWLKLVLEEQLDTFLVDVGGLSFHGETEEEAVDDVLKSLLPFINKKYVVGKQRLEANVDHIRTVVMNKLHKTEDGSGFSLFASIDDMNNKTSKIFGLVESHDQGGGGGSGAEAETDEVETEGSGVDDEIDLLSDKQLRERLQDLDRQLLDLVNERSRAFAALQLRRGG